MGNKPGYQRFVGMPSGPENDVIPEGDPEIGAKIFREHCAGCHDIDKSGEHRAGPNLMGLWGREASTIDGFPFEKSDEKQGIIWGDKTIFDYFEKPHIPGTKFLFRDLKGRADDKASLVAYLRKATDPAKS